MYVCLRHRLQFSLRPLIGPHITLADPSLSLVNPPPPPPSESSFKNVSVDMTTNTIYSVSLKLKLAVICQNWKKNNFFWLLNISAPLDGIVGSKAVNKTLLEVLTKTGEAKSKKELEFLQHHGF